MPEISRFMGMVIRMFYNDHEKPHIHIFQAGKYTKIDFDGNVVKGYLSQNKLYIVREWIRLHQEELIDNWNKIRNKKFPERIEPWKK